MIGQPHQLLGQQQRPKTFVRKIAVAGEDIMNLEAFQDVQMQSVKLYPWSARLRYSAKAGPRSSMLVSITATASSETIRLTASAKEGFAGIVSLAL